MTAKRMTSGLVLKQRNGEPVVIQRSYETTLPTSSQFLLTKPTGAFIRKRIRLAFLSPKIQAAICDGTLPPEITAEHISRQNLPHDWIVQERMFGT